MTRRHLLLLVLSACVAPPAPSRAAFERRLSARFDALPFDRCVFA